MIYLIRRERFNAAHRLFNPNLTDEKNFNMYGKCSNPSWHGHNYVLFVTVKGETKNETGFLVNIKTLSKLIQDHVIEKLDHKNINIDVDFMQGKIASTENLAISIWDELKKPIEKLGCQLHCIKIEETENNYVEYYGKK
ncbi:6-pyruvoyl tetrahydropterin synthase family protein [Bacteroidota bacterium]